MNIYRIQVILDVIASDDELAVEKVKSDIKEEFTDLKDIKILWDEEYS